MKVYAGWPNEGLAADPARARHLLVEAGERGCLAACKELASGYTRGRWGFEDRQDQPDWLRRSAEQGDVVSGVRAAALDATAAEDPALQLLRAAEAGDSESCRKLAQKQLQAAAGERDEAAAGRWLLRAVETPEPDLLAFALLGDFHRQGRGGFAVDEEEAVRCYEMALQFDDPDANAVAARGMRSLGRASPYLEEDL